jgi:hypothetical protein
MSSFPRNPSSGFLKVLCDLDRSHSSATQRFLQSLSTQQQILGRTQTPRRSTEQEAVEDKRDCVCVCACACVCVRVCVCV